MIVRCVENRSRVKVTSTFTQSQRNLGGQRKKDCYKPTDIQSTETAGPYGTGGLKMGEISQKVTI